jgi:peptide/nickel transport system ATP-binding protein
VVKNISDRVVVMYLGRVVEEGPAASVWSAPSHPYTSTLLSAAPGSGRTRIVLEGDPPNPADPPSGCVFHTRCPVAFDQCPVEAPTLRTVGSRHNSACLLTSPERPVAMQPVTAMS